jgi:hypothetical protein
MIEITDQFMQQMLLKTKKYFVVVLKAGPKINEPGAEKIIWEHGRRNFALREEKILSIVCPVGNDINIKGFGIFNANLEEVRKIMDGDPGVKAGIFLYEIYECRSFPGDELPE